MTAVTTIGTPVQQRQLKVYLELVRAANNKINLVSRRDIDYLMEHHVAPSCLFIVLKRLAAQEYILDIGSGGGFPGIVCAIFQPDSNFVLVDSTRKKTDFLRTVVEQLGLKNIKVLWQRVETMATEPRWQRKFDRTISRAVAPLTDLVQWSQPLLKKTGTVEALKGKLVATVEAKMLKQSVIFHTPPTDWQWNDHLATVTIATVLPK
ncbi:MAG: hypothetical protein ACD_43C00243G0002 [uncultured bacterium]|nr:MAG: hypothetical protein ACD_43C00243G0002 [uncultured bacterium]